MIGRPALPLVVLLLLASCYFGRATVNEPLDPAVLQQLQPGKTTAQQAVDLLGAPSDVVQLGKRVAYRYDHSLQKEAATWIIVVALLNTDRRDDRIWLFFDEAGVLSHVGATLAAHRPQYAFPWEDVHESSDSASADEERFGAKR